MRYDKREMRKTQSKNYTYLGKKKKKKRKAEVMFRENLGKKYMKIAILVFPSVKQSRFYTKNVINVG